MNLLYWAKLRTCFYRHFLDKQGSAFTVLRIGRRSRRRGWVRQRRDCGASRRHLSARLRRMSVGCELRLYRNTCDEFHCSGEISRENIEDKSKLSCIIIRDYNNNFRRLYNGNVEKITSGVDLNRGVCFLYTCCGYCVTRVMICGRRVFGKVHDQNIKNLDTRIIKK